MQNAPGLFEMISHPNNDREKSGGGIDAEERKTWVLMPRGSCQGPKRGGFSTSYGPGRVHGNQVEMILVEADPEP
jgi:hypothetical protein